VSGWDRALLLGSARRGASLSKPRTAAASSASSALHPLAAPAFRCASQCAASTSVAYRSWNMAGPHRSACLPRRILYSLPCCHRALVHEFSRNVLICVIYFRKQSRTLIAT
jgi:hypothetical protein